MSVRDNDKFLQRIKKTLLIPAEDTFADDEIKLHIEGLILIYVKTFFGFKADGSVKELPASFHLLVRQLVFTSMEV